MELAMEQLTKRFKDITAVHEVSLRLSSGVWGLLGANGAGKTTLMRMVAGILTPSGGRVMLDGVNINILGENYRDILGYLPQDFGFYPEFTANDYLHYMAALKGIDKRKMQERIDSLLKTVGLENVRRKQVRKFSGGMQRRLGIAQALLNDPSILILDEPTSGLDPSERVHFRKILSGLGQNRIVLISTHIVSDIEYIADKNIILRQGRILAFGTTEELVRQADGLVWESELSGDLLPNLEQQTQVVNVKSGDSGLVTVRYLSKEAMVKNSRPASPRLEDLYLWVFREETAGRQTRT